MEVREFDWDSSRKGASQLSRTKTIRLGTPKTTTGEILIFALTSPLKRLKNPAVLHDSTVYCKSQDMAHFNLVAVRVSDDLCILLPFFVLLLASVSNLGMFGITNFTAIINPPQASILAVGTSQLRPNAAGAGVQTVVSMSYCFDARAISEKHAADFLNVLRYNLEMPHVPPLL